jgi:hypothetical protein
MATATPIAYNPSLTAISGTTQIGVFSVGTPISGFTGEPRWWNSPDLDLGYIIGVPSPDCNITTANSGETACFSFYRTSATTDQSFIELSNIITGIPFTSVTNAQTYMVNYLGYYTNYPSSAITLNDYYQGGIIGYIFQPGEPRYVSGETHGIIVSTKTYGTRAGDILAGTGYTWGCDGVVTGLSEVIGSGYTNQVNIINYLNANCSPSNSAYTQSAFLFATGLTDNGYNDWYIGSFNEYNAVFSGTGALNLPAYTPNSWSPTANAYISSRQSDAPFASTNNVAAIFDSLFPPAYRPAGTFAGLKSLMLNVKPLRYF